MVRAGCIAGRTPRGFCHRLLTAGGGTRVSAEAGQFSRWGRGPVLPVGVRLTRRVREEPPPGELARVYFDRNATMSGAKRRGSAGMDRRPNAAWVSSPAVQPGWIAGRAPTGRTGPRGFHHRLSKPVAGYRHLLPASLGGSRQLRRAPRRLRASGWFGRSGRTRSPRFWRICASRSRCSSVRMPASRS